MYNPLTTKPNVLNVQTFLSEGLQQNYCHQNGFTKNQHVENVYIFVLHYHFSIEYCQSNTYKNVKAFSTS